VLVPGGDFREEIDRLRLRDWQLDAVTSLLASGIVQGDLNRNGVFGARAGNTVPLIRPGKPEQSYLVGRLRGELEGERIPGTQMPLANQPPSVPDMVALMCFIEGLHPDPSVRDPTGPIDYGNCSYTSWRRRTWTRWRPGSSPARSRTVERTGEGPAYTPRRMEGRLVLKDCSIFRGDGRVRTGMAVVIEGDRITRVVPDEQAPILPGDWEVACRGRLVMPGLVDCHAHLVGEQLVPSSGAFQLRPAPARFELQHRLAREVTGAELEALTAWGMARSLRNGVTMVAEHLQAPTDVRAALETQGRVAERLGMRAVLSHATHSRDGGGAALDQLEANAAFAAERHRHPLVRGALGFHSSSTATDELLRRVGRLREELGVGVQFHLAEHADDLMATYAQSGRRVVPRLESFGLVGPGLVGSYARTLDRSEADRLAKSRTLVALHPRDALEGEPGGGGLECVLTQQPMLGLGTAGRGTPWQQLTCAFATALQIARMGRLLDPDGLMAQLLISGPAELCSMIFGAPSGCVEVGALADIAVYDLVPATEVPGGAATQLLMQLAEVPVAWTITAGRVTVREGQLVGADHVDLAREAARALEAVWRRVDSPGAPA
jgi:5-methylthioadenosine/S-adenosylhomocysteine deaminase